MPTKQELESALDKICPPWVESDPKNLPQANPNPFFDRMFEFSEFNTALNSKNSKSSSGMDGIDYLVLKIYPYNTN